MDVFSWGIPAGRYFGINVRLHFTFLLFAFYRIQRYHNPVYGVLFVAAIYLCILLHEFGHALAARWCDGDADDILLWPLGGLAFVRPAFDATAHLITTVAGPFVTLVLWGLLHWLAIGLEKIPAVPLVVVGFVHYLSVYNLGLLLFNLIPAFPMDGGRILRDTIWHWMSAETATQIAVQVSRLLAIFGVACVFLPPGFWFNLLENSSVPWAVVGFLSSLSQNYWFLLFPAFILFSTVSELHYLAAELRGATYGFSVRERIRRGWKKRRFRQAVAEGEQLRAEATFHKCTTCGATEIESPHMDFRVCTECDGDHEYCREHLDKHEHVRSPSVAS